ncbi:MAG: hypothetical protein QOF37_3076 [Thermoleophilaceae bacterium]|nr:hypothetical protein [Thermoleophilaceae bacterium]
MTDFDLVASSLRADAADARALAEALAVKLEGALPQQTRVQRRSKGLLSRTKVVRRIEVDCGDSRYSLDVDDRGAPRAVRAQEVRGIVLKNEPLALDAWIDALARDLTAMAQSSEQGRLALERLLI